MKNAKNICIVSVLAVALVNMPSIVIAGAAGLASKAATLNQQLAPKNPGFALRNRLSTVITYSLSTGDSPLATTNVIVQNKSVAPGTEDLQNVQKTLFAKLTIINSSGRQYVYMIKPQRKTIYLTLENAGLRPAGATLASGKSATESGLSVGFMGATNVQQGEIALQ
jgi:hypothetical protein